MMDIQALSMNHLPSLLSFYAGLPESVTLLFEPFGPRVTEETLKKHLTGTEAGTNVSLGLVDPQGVVHGHVFILSIATASPVFGIGLAEDAQGQGWGRRMARAVLAEADARGVKRVTLTVVKTNRRAWTLYESLGFRRTGETTFRVANDSYCMERG